MITRQFTNPDRTQIAGIVLCLLAGSNAHADDVILRSSAVLASDAMAIRLRDAADLVGPAAQALGDMTIAELPAGTNRRTLTLAQIRSALERAGAPWGGLNLSGPPSVLCLRRSLTPSTTESVPSSRSDKAAGREVPVQMPAGAWMESPSALGAAARLLVSALQTAPEHLQLVIDGREETAWTAAPPGGRVEIEPLSSLQSDRIHLAVRTWAGTQIASRTSLTLRPLVRVVAAVAARDLERQERIGPGDAAEQELWLAPSQAAGALRSADLVGRTTARRARVGDVLRGPDLRAEHVIRRGDKAIVRCVVGGAVISLQAEAMADAAVGQSIEFRKPGARQTFLAVVTAPGEAIVESSTLSTSR